MEEGKFFYEIASRLKMSKERAEEVATAVMRELHDRLTPREANDFAAQLPGGIKQMWHGFDTPDRTVERIHKRDFIRYVAEEAGIPEDEASKAVMVVFKVVQMLLQSPTGQEGEAWDIFSQLPKDLKRAWLEAAAMK